MKIDEPEENNRKRLAEATLQEFELLDAVSKGTQSETTASARRSMRSEKAVQDWINTSLALSFNNEEKTSEPDVMIDSPECPSHNNGKLWKIRTLTFQGILFKNCRGNYILSNTGMTSSHRTWFKDSWFGVRTYQSLKHQNSSKLL